MSDDASKKTDDAELDDLQIIIKSDQNPQLLRTITGMVGCFISSARLLSLHLGSLSLHDARTL